MSSMKEKLKAVAGAIAAIEKQFGKGAIMPLSGGDVAEIATAHLAEALQYRVLDQPTT